MSVIHQLHDSNFFCLKCQIPSESWSFIVLCVPANKSPLKYFVFPTLPLVQFSCSLLEMIILYYPDQHHQQQQQYDGSTSASTTIRMDLQQHHHTKTSKLPQNHHHELNIIIAIININIVIFIIMIIGSKMIITVLYPCSSSSTLPSRNSRLWSCSRRRYSSS